MKKYKHIFIACLLVISSSSTVMADDMSENERTYQPTAEQMILDGLVYRPLSLAGTIIGTGIYIVTLPFSLMGGNAEQAGETLVVEPAKTTFGRCLGCLPDYNHSNYQD